METTQLRAPDEEPQPIEYTVREGTIDQGRNYEVGMTSLLALRCLLTDEEDVWFAFNASDVGEFDDIVFRFGKNAFLIQLKHKVNEKPILSKEFLDKKGHFSLFKYFQSISTLKKSLNVQDDVSKLLRHLRAFENIYFILFTNRSLESYEFWQTCDNEALKLLNTNAGQIYQLNTINLPKSCNLPDLDNQSAFHLMSSQINAQNISESIAEELEKVARKFKLTEIDVEYVAEQFTKYITSWTRGELGAHYCLSKREIIQKLCEILLGNYEIHLDDDVFPIHERIPVKIWKKVMNTVTLAFLNYDENIIKFLNEYVASETIKCCDQLALSWMSKLSHKNEDLLYQNHIPLKSQMFKVARNRCGISVTNVYKCLWLTKILPVLLTIHNQNDYNNILQILKMSNYSYKAILVQKNRVEHNFLSQKDGIKHFFTLEDVDQEERNVLLKLQVKFQGRYVQLRHLVDESSFKLVYCNDIINILLDNFSIGANINRCPDYFIGRQLSKVFIKPEALEDIKDETFVIEGNCEEDSKTFRIENDNVKHFEDFEFSKVQHQRLIKYNSDLGQERTEREYHAVHRLRVYNEHYLEWITSYGPVKQLRPFRVKLNDVWEDNVINNDISNLTVISDSPGMGKSVLMDHMAWTVPSTKWVFNINLNLYMTNRASATEATDHLKQMNEFACNRSECNRELTNAVFEKLQSSGDVVVLLDGFDEVGMLYKEELVDMVKSLYNEGYHIVLTTRQHMESYLEEELNTFAVSLKPFSVEDQKIFLEKYFCGRNNALSTNYNLTIEFIEKLLAATKRNLNDIDGSFTGIPLQTKLLADVFFDDCQRFVVDNKTNMFNEDFRFLYLYRNLIIGKADILRNKFGITGEVTFNFFKTVQAMYALKIVFPLYTDIISHIEKQLPVKIQKSEEMRAILFLLQQAGIVTLDKDFNVNFIHRTVSEYVVAQWLSENFKSEDFNLRTNIRVLMNERFSGHYKFLFVLFDHIVTEKCPLHKSIIHGQINEVLKSIKLEDLFTTDDCNRTILHMASLYSNCYKNYDQKNSIDNILLQIPCGIPKEKVLEFEQDTFGLSPLDYALATGSLNTADALVTQLRLSTIRTNINLDRKVQYLTYCVENNCKALFYILLVYFITKELFLNKVHKNELLESYCLRMEKFSEMRILKEITHTFLNVSAKVKNASLSELTLSQSLKVSPNLSDSQFQLHKFIVFESSNYLLKDQCRRFEINNYDMFYNAPLHYAVLHNKCYFCKTLMLEGADVNQYDEEKNTPLHLALLRNNEDLARLLISKRADVTLENRVGNNSLHISSHYGFNRLIRSILRLGVDINRKNKTGNTALHISLCNKKLETAKLLISRHADVSLQNNQGKSSLHYGTEYGDYDILCQISSRHTDINQQNNNGDPALHYAVWKNQLQLVKLLIFLGANVSLQNSQGKSSLHYGTEYGHDDILREILLHHTDINQKNNNGDPALHYAVWKNQLNLVKFLLYKGANASLQNNQCKSSLHYAAEYGYDDILREILPKNVDVNQQDHNGNTALHCAVLTNNLQTAKLLISRGADISVQNKKGTSSIHLAAKFGYDEILNDILSHDIDINQQDSNGNPILHYAVWGNKLETVKWLISRGADISQQNSEGTSCLHLAAEYGHDEILCEILRHRLDINQGDNVGNPPIHYAVWGNELKAVKLLISRGADFSLQNNGGIGSLHLAAERGYDDILCEILSHAVDINQKDSNGDSPLRYAVWTNKLETVKWLISRGADVSQQNSEGTNCLHLAAEFGHIEILHEILSHPVDINQKDNRGSPPIHYAIWKNELETARLLISEGADVSLQNTGGKGSLHLAAEFGHIEILHEILSHPVDINQKDNRGSPPIHYAIWKNKLETARLLISEGADVSLQNTGGKGGLHLAAERGYDDILREILSHDVDINQKDRKGNSPLHYAVRRSKLETVKLLISEGADISQQNNMGASSLHFAAEYGHDDVLCEILSHPVDVNQKDNRGSPPIHYAIWKNKLETVRLLISGGAVVSLQNTGGKGSLRLAAERGYDDILCEILSHCKIL